MLAESRAFLFDHGYEAGLHIRAYTSKTRDAERAKRGLPPLKDSEAEVAGDAGGRHPQLAGGVGKRR